jgi:hypothetical protein
MRLNLPSTLVGLAMQRGGQSFRPSSIISFKNKYTTDTQRRWSSKVMSNAPSVDARVTTSRPFYQMYYNDVYAVTLPPRHRFPMEKYGQVRRQVQQWVSELSEEERDEVHCGKYLWHRMKNLSNKCVLQYLLFPHYRVSRLSSSNL